MNSSNTTGSQTMDHTGGRVLGIDYGTKRIGLAVSDPTHCIAQGIDTITLGSGAKTFAIIGKVIAEYGIAQIVVGLPLTLKGEIGATAITVQKFARKLTAEFALPVHLVDERFTSVIAQQTMRLVGLAPSKNKGRVDQIAASLILQSYLDSPFTGCGVSCA